MNVEYTKVDEVNGLITIAATQDDFKEEINKQLRQLAKTRPEPGYRPGHVPMGLIERKYGQAVRYEVIDKQVSRQLYDFIQREQLKVLGAPIADDSNLTDLGADDMVFRFKVGLAPEISVNVEDVEIPYYEIGVTDDMIQRQDEQLRRRYGKQVKGEEVEPNALVKGPIAELDADGNVKPGGISVDSGILSPQHFTDEEQKALFVGRKLGDSVVFNPWKTCDGAPVELSSMLHISKEEAADVKGDFRMDITEIIVLRPAEDGPEFYDEAFGKDKVHNAGEYREAVSAMVAAQLSSDSSYRFTVDAREALMKAVGDFQLPDKVLTIFLMSQDEKLTSEGAETEYKRMEPGLRWQLVSDAVSRQLDIKLSEDDLMDVARMATRNQFAQYGMGNVPAEVLDKYAGEMLKDEKVRERLASQAVEMKLFNGIRAKAKVDVKKVSVDEFNALFTNKD